MRAIATNNTTTRQRSGRRKNRLGLLIHVALVRTVAVIASGSSSSGVPSSLGDISSGSGDLAPDFSIPMYQGQDVVGGQEVSLSSLTGQKPIVLNFWAGLCPPCRAEMPDLQEFNEKFQDRTLLVGIDIGQFTGLGTQKDAQNLLDELGVTYPAGFTTEGNVIKDYQVLGMPTTIFIDAEGKIFNKWTGALNLSVLEEKTLEMLNQ